MFNFFRKRTAEEFLEEAKETYIAPKKEEKEKPVTTYYRLGLTDNNRVSLQMGYTEINMNRQGIQQLIDQLTVFMNQLDVEKEQEDDSKS